MSKPLPPSNYSWVDNTLTFSLPNDATGVKLKYQKTGETIWIDILNSPDSPLTSCQLDSTLGPTGTVCGMSAKDESLGKEWGDESCSVISNQV